MASQWHADAFFVGREIVARLAAEVPALRDVRLADEIPDDEREPRQAPSAAVALADMSPAPSEGLSPVSALGQIWLVMLAVRSAAADSDRGAKGAGPLIPAVVAALHGWVPPGQRRPLAWTRTGLAPRFAGKFAYYPLAFALTLAV